MAVKMLGSCSCGYPLTAQYNGQKVSCPYCHSVNEATISQGINVPTWLMAGGIGLLIGIILGPALLASTEEGSRWLGRRVRRASHAG